MYKLRLSKTGLSHLLLFGFITIFVLVFLALWTSGRPAVASDITILSYIITFLFFLSLYTLAKIEQQVYSLTGILLTIAFLFNFGQLFLWTLGLHTDTEIGKTTLYANFPIPNVEQIYNASLFSAYCYTAMVLGVLSVKILKFSDSHFSPRKASYQDLLHQMIYKVSLGLGVLVVPVTFYKIFLLLRQSLTHGYISLYYSDFSVGPLISRSEDYFFPVIVGLLLGSRYKKVKLAYTLFALYMVLYTLAGERGNWFYKLLVLIWMHNAYYKKIDKIKFLKLIGVGLVFLSLLSVIISARSYGLANLTFAELSAMFDVKENILVRFIQEMGGSLGVTIIVLSFGQGPFAQFGNTFVSSAMTSVSTALASRLGVGHIYLGNYLSQDLLKIRWGTGFTFFAETFVNAGWLGFIYMYFFGILFAELLRDDKGILQRYIACVSCVVLSSMMRDSSLYGFRQMVQVVLLIVGVVWLSAKYMRGRENV